MINYNFEEYTEWIFKNIRTEEVSERDQWIDIYLGFDLAEDNKKPQNLVSPSALFIFSHSGQLIQSILLDEGCDSEYRFTDSEKEQLLSYIREKGLLNDVISGS